MLKILSTPAEWRHINRTNEMKNKTIGFVPTMGALHKGHLSLVERCLKENDITIVSIFVNPTQFNDSTDFSSYPKTLKEDKVLLKKAGISWLFLPSYETLYADGYSYKIIETKLSKKLCGAHRPAHFDGVLTVVMKLLNIIKATRAYFGEKDYQQYLLIKKMTKTFFIDTEIIPCNTVRESSGLACSSRNNILSPKDRARASEFYHILSKNISKKEMQTQLENSGFTVDYIKNLNNRRLGAVVLNNVRLIDNVTL